jgi:hypothetical protein
MIMGGCAAAMLCALIASLALSVGPAEPSYKQRPFRFWLDCFGTSPDGIRADAAKEIARVGPEMAHKEALAAIDEMGMAAYSYLVQTLGRPEPSRLSTEWVKLRRRLRFSYGLDPVPLRARQIQTVDVFQTLGTNANAASPKLQSIIERARPNEFVVYSLAAVNPKSCVALLKHANVNIRHAAADALGSVRADQTIALSALRECLTGNDEYLRRNALSSIQRIHNTAFISMSRSGPVRVVKRLMDHGANVNSQDESGSALSWAAESGNKEICELLLANGASEDATNGLGEKVLEIAIRAHRSEIVAILKERDQHRTQQFPTNVPRGKH